MFDAIGAAADFVSPHWLSEYFPGKLKDRILQTAHHSPSSQNIFL